MGQISPRLIIIALVAVTTMSLVPVLVKATSAQIETIGMARLLIALCFITPAVLVKGCLRSLNLRAWLGMAFLGLVFGGHWWTYFFAIKTAGASLGAIAMSTFGIHLLLLNWWIHKQRINVIEIICIGVCIAGCLLVIPWKSAGDNVLWGFAIGVFSALLYGSMPLLHRRIVALPTLTRTWGQFGFAALFFSLFWPQMNWHLAASDWGLLLALGIVCTLVAHGLWVKASTELPGVVTSSIYYLYTPLSMVQAHFFIDESITFSMVVGTGLIIIANLVILIIPWVRLQRRLD